MWLRDQLKHHMASKQDSNPCMQGSSDDMQGSSDDICAAICQVQPTAWTAEGTQVPVQLQQEPQQVAAPKHRPIARAAGSATSSRRHCAS